MKQFDKKLLIYVLICCAKFILLHKNNVIKIPFPYSKTPETKMVTKIY